MDRIRHPSCPNKTPKLLFELSRLARDLSHELDEHFDSLQDIANCLHDYGMEKEGYTLIALEDRCP